MKTLLALLILIGTPELWAMETLSEQEAARIADAIYIIEGGKKAKVPYGILSVKVRNAADARRICLNTIRNNHVRWQKAGKPGAFVDFLADRYCPAIDRVGNKNWKKNIRLVLKQYWVGRRQPI